MRSLRKSNLSDLYSGTNDISALVRCFVCGKVGPDKVPAGTNDVAKMLRCLILSYPGIDCVLTTNDVAKLWRMVHSHLSGQPQP